MCGEVGLHFTQTPLYKIALPLSRRGAACLDVSMQQLLVVGQSSKMARITLLRGQDTDTACSDVVLYHVLRACMHTTDKGVICRSKPVVCARKYWSPFSAMGLAARHSLNCVS